MKFDKNNNARGTAVLALAALTLLAACSKEEAAPPTPVLSAAEQCMKLNGMMIAATSIGEPTSGAVITSAELVAADAEKNRNGEFCKVLGDIKPVDTTAPDIKFEVNLPTNWNKKTLHFGGGGLNGVLQTGLGYYAKQPESEDTALKRGYVTLGSDSGHQSTRGFDGTFYLNEEALENYGHKQLKKTHDVAIALIQARFGSKPERNYFIGGSQGGHEGFDVVQRYPDDYDGVVAGYPAHNVVMLHLSAWNTAKALQAKGAWINPNKAQALVAKVYERCDKLDGAEDGIISDLASCETTNAPLKLLTRDNPIRCANGKDTGDTCLSDEQIKALAVNDVPYKVGFPIWSDDVGSAEFPKWTHFSGSTFADGGLKILGGENPQQALQFAPGAATLGFAIARDANLNVYEKFDPKMYEERIKELAMKMSANSTDLDKFKAKGGKLIFFHGLVDDFISPYSSIQYFSRLQAKYDFANLSSFVRFYTVPGMGHVTGVFNARISSLDALEKWVEQGQAPTELLATDANKETAGRSRPVCQYPAWPHLIGEGDLNSASAFTCLN